MNNSLAEELVNVVHARILALRNIENLVSQRDFQELVNNSEKQLVQRLINEFNYKGLRAWYKKRRIEEIGALGVRELRQLASKLGVPGYNFMQKPMLLSEITKRKSNVERAINEGNSPTSHGNEVLDSESGDSGDKIPITFEIDAGTNSVGTNGTSHVAH